MFARSSQLCVERTSSNQCNDWRLRQHLPRLLSPQRVSLLGQINTWQCFLLTADVVDQHWSVNYHLPSVHLLLLLGKVEKVSSIKSPKRNIHGTHSRLTARLNHFLPEWARRWAFGSLTFTRASFSPPVVHLRFDDTSAWRQGRTLWEENSAV